MLALPNCLAQPGARPLSLPAEAANLEIVDWAAAPTPNPVPGEFVVRLAGPMPLGSVAVYGADKVSWESGGRWETLEPAGEAGRRLQFLPLPPGALVEAVKFTVNATEQPRTPGRPPEFQAVLPFATFLPIRVVNIARDATVNWGGSPAGRRPADWVDGVLTPTADPLPPGSSNDWLMLHWTAPQSFRGLAVFRAGSTPGPGVSVIEVHTGHGDPVAAGDSTNDWRRLGGRATAPGRFFANEFFVTPRVQETRAIRLRGAPGGGLGAGEIVVLRDLGAEPVPAVAGAARPGPVRVLEVPKAAGRIAVDGQATDWPAGRTNGFAFAWDAERLYVLHQATGERAHFANAGTNVQQLFHTGDVLELMLQTRTGLDAQRSQAGRGDVRLVFSEFQGRPAVVLYQFHTDDLLLLPVTFRAGDRALECDKVTEMREAQLAWRTTNGTLTVEASVPWAALGGEPGPWLETRGDFGRITGPPPRRERWADTTTPAPTDVVAGAELHPARWGVLRFNGR